MDCNMSFTCDLIISMVMSLTCHEIVTTNGTRLTSKMSPARSTFGYCFMMPTAMGVKHTQTTCGCCHTVLSFSDPTSGQNRRFGHPDVICNDGAGIMQFL